MRFRHGDGTVVHLAYCTNVHAAEDLDGVLGQLAAYAGPVRRRLGADRLGVGLWLAAPVAAGLAADPAGLPQLRDALDRHGLEVVTLNCFPYAGFHAPSVKKAVYQPDWADPARLDYTVACARVLAGLLPDDARRGSLSTLPLAWREPWPAGRADLAKRHLDALTAGLARLAAETGRVIRVGLEPEPGCLAENTTQASRVLTGCDPGWLGVCLDICHLAVAFEDPARACARLAAAGLPVVKAQVSCALHVDDPADPAARAELGRFAEPRFLHQTRAAAPGARPAAGGSLDGPGAGRPPDALAGLPGADDLPDALAGQVPADRPWRVHFHLPVHADLRPPLRSTRPVLRAALDALLGGPAAVTDHLEVETYTWPVLPGGPAAAGDLVAGLAAELGWTRDGLLSLGLKEDR